MIKTFSAIVFVVLCHLSGFSNTFEKDVIKTSKGDLVLTFIGHGTLIMEWNGKVVHIDPVSWYADYANMPKADLILITHEHGDHLDTKAINAVKKEGTRIVLTPVCTEKYTGTDIMKNGEHTSIFGMDIKAVPAYNIKHTRDNGAPFHPKGRGNGYVISFANKKVYVAGDTENIPEMAELKNIDIAFLPMNLPYTMTPAMVADAAEIIQPDILYPYHVGKTDTRELQKLMVLKKLKKTELRIRKLN
jgi:L-ascorbate metabolism protein UlaG (beta-lactamase superfamily)